MRLKQTRAASAFRATIRADVPMRRSRRLLALCAVAVAVVAAVPAPAIADVPAPGAYSGYLHRGPTIPFAGQAWVPQGLAKIGENSLVISYYDSSDSPRHSRLRWCPSRRRTPTPVPTIRSTASITARSPDCREPEPGWHRRRSDQAPQRVVGGVHHVGQTGASFDHSRDGDSVEQTGDEEMSLGSRVPRE